MSETQNIEVFPDDFSPVRTRSSRAKETEKVNEDATTMDERNEKELQKTSEEIGKEQLLNSEARSVTKSKVSRKSKSQSSTTSTKRKLIEMRKAAKLAQIRLEAIKHEAELRAREVQLENERRIKEQQLQVDIADAELEAEQSITESDDSSSQESIERERESQPKSVLESLPKEQQEDRVQRLLSDVADVKKPEGDAKPGQSAENEKSMNKASQETGEPNYLFRLGTEIAKQSKPPIKIFTGSVDKFVSFKATFDRIKQRGIYDENEMLDLLLEHVRDDAENALKGILPGSGQFDRAMKILEERFGNVRTITNANLKALRSHPQVQGHNPSQLRSLSDVISNMIESFRSLKLNRELKSSFIVQEAVAKLPTFLFYKWHEWSSDHPERVNLEEFYSWLETRARHLENAHLSSTVSQTGADRRGQRHKVFAGRTNYGREETNSSCPIHNSRNHTLECYKAFQQMSPQEKENVIHKLKLCFRCLRSNHLARSCNRKVKCGTDGCTDNHNN